MIGDVVQDGVMPHDLDAERAVLGAVMFDQTRLPVVRSIIEPSECFRRAHALIFEGIIRVHDAGGAVDLTTVSSDLRTAGKLDEVGGPAYIASLTEWMPFSANAESYARIVKEKFILRQLIQGGRHALNRAYNGDLDGARVALAAAIEGANSADERQAGRLVNDVDILATPDVPYIIENILPARSIYGLVAPQGAGKTTVAMGLGMAIPTGQPFLGHAIATSGPSIYVLLEGQTHAKARIGALKQAMHVALEETSGFFLWLDGLDLLNPRSVGRLIEASRKVAPTNLTIDTWAMAFGGDENSSRDVGLGLRALQRIRDELGCAVGIVHHTNAMATRERGSTALRAGLDMLMMLTVADDALTLVCEKQRDGAPFAEIPIRLTPVPGSAAQVVRLAVDVLPSVELTTPQQRALSRLCESFVSGASSSEWRTTVPEIPDRSFYRIQAELVRRGVVLTEGQGRHVRYRPANRVTATLPTSLPTSLP